MLAKFTHALSSKSTNEEEAGWRCQTILSNGSRISPSAGYWMGNRGLLEGPRMGLDGRWLMAGGKVYYEWKEGKREREQDRGWPLITGIET